jgi:MoaA/NifB/PqqE/SkfB family radical SAM enzyme
MWKEWLYPYNAFNDIKVLYHGEHLRKIVDWMDRKEGAVLPPPAYITIDPTNLCNVECFWCKNKDFRNHSSRSISDEQFVALPAFLKKWGVTTVVLSGGEPLMHPKILEFLDATGEVGLHLGLKTNGLNLAKKTIRDSVRKNVEWVGISLDAATDKTYMRVKKASAEMFDKVIHGIKSLIEEREGKKPLVTLKFIIHHLNYGEMYAFANLARMMRVDDIHFRPIYVSRYRYHIGVRKTAAHYMREARKDFESEDFRIYGIVHKFDQMWEKIVRFKKCYAVALSGVFAADGRFYLCADQRGNDSMSLGKFFPFEDIQKKWGSEEHRKAILKIIPQLCPKCGMSTANEVVEKCIISDEMLLRFI